MTIPTNRPFFSNFLAAFRAQSALQKGTGAGTSASTTSAFAQSAAAAAAGTTTAASTLTSASAAASARAISTKAGTSSPPLPIGTPGKQQFQPTRQHHTSTSPLSRSPGGPGSPTYHQHRHHTQALGGMTNRNRRGSDSSGSEGGFRDAPGGDKWYIGGRAPNGEERFYKLSMVKRPRSADRLSIDRLSL
jgi:hypothetical protein